MAQILMVDDSSTVRNAVGDFLTKSDVTVSLEVDERDGLAKLKSDSSIKLVVFDVNMPNMNGLTMAEKVRGDCMMFHTHLVRMGEQCYMAVMGIDITDRKQAGRSLFRESEKYKALLRNASDGITIMDVNANIIEVSESFCTMLGYSRDEMIGMNVTRWDCGFNSQDELMAAFRQQYQSKARSLFLSRHRRKDGSVYDVEIHSQQIDLEDHLVLYSSYRDITVRLQSQSFIDKQIKALELSEAQMATSQRISGTGSCVYDFNTDIVRASTQMVRMFGLSTDIADRPLDDFLAFVPQHRDLIRQTLAGKFGFPIDIADYPLDDLLSGIPEHDPVHQTLTDLINQSHQYDAEFALQPADGFPTRIIHAIGKLERDSQGIPVNIFGFIQDVTERRKTESELKEAKIAADAANVAKSRFLATMSHEIRTPMNGILGMAQLLLMPSLTDNERDVYTKTIFSSGQTLLALLNDILDLSKIEAGKFQLENIVFEPVSILSETQRLFSGAAHAKGLQFEYQWNGLPGSRYLSDATRIRQMLMNLVGNAVKFTKEGCVRIEGVLREQDGESALLEFSVSDSGMGIPPEKIDLLFKPFSQTDSSITREFGGSGLGLSIVCNLAKMMGGNVGVESVAGKGSRFWFSLRAKHVEDSENFRSSERPAIAMTEHVQLSRRVLVVEDNVVNRMVIESMLTKLGIRVTLAHDGLQALDTLTHGECSDLVMMDLNMPVMDGYGATEQIRLWERNNNRPRLPIVALTADAYEENRQHCLALGMDDFLTKPISLDALKSTLTKWLPTPNQRETPPNCAASPVHHG
jgi:PAS domain S-box-containing protein